MPFQTPMMIKITGQKLCTKCLLISPSKNITPSPISMNAPMGPFRKPSRPKSRAPKSAAPDDGGGGAPPVFAPEGGAAAALAAVGGVAADAGVSRPNMLLIPNGSGTFSPVMRDFAVMYASHIMYKK